MELSQKPERLLREKHLLEERLIPFGHTQLWRLTKAGKFPRPLRIGSMTCWRESDIARWQQEQGITA